MSEKFTASNGWYIEDGRLYDEVRDWVLTLGKAEDAALVEYGRHLERTERDRELGRERVEGYPDYAVYPYKNGAIRVLDEVTGNALFWLNDGDIEAAARSAFASVARAWFAQQEAPKCKAALNVKGEHFGCDKGERHGGAHGNTDAGAIWGEAGDES